MPEAWAGAGAAPYDNIIGSDPELVDPQGGDFRAVRAEGYGCRVFGPPVLRSVTEATPSGPPLARQGRRDVGGEITTDTLWDATEIRVVDDVTVRGGASLCIAAGSQVRFAGFHALRVLDGDLQAVGTSEQPIVFTSEQPELWHPDLGREGAWNGLAFFNVPAVRDSSRLRWCVIEYAKALPGEDWLVPAGPGGALVAGVGGAVRVAGGSPLLISHSVLRRNVAVRGGAIGIHHGARPLLVNNLLHDNRATHRASAIYISYADAVIAHSTITGNDVTAHSPAVETGAIDHVFSRPWHHGNIVWRNTTSYYWSLQIREPKAINTRYCDIEEWLGGEGCLSVEPELIGFVPAAGSPVVDAAVETGWLPARDLADAPRVLGDAPDMGAFEAGQVTAVLPIGARASLRSWPNPANPRATIALRRDGTGPVTLTVYDLRGRLVRHLGRDVSKDGEQHWIWDGRDHRGRLVAAGSYVVRATTSGGDATARLTVVR